MPDTPHNHEQCRELFARLSEYLDNELDEGAYRVMEDHLRQCPPCQVCLTTLKRTVALCRASQAQPVRQAFSQRMREIIAKLQ